MKRKYSIFIKNANLTGYHKQEVDAILKEQPQNTFSIYIISIPDSIWWFTPLNVLLMFVESIYWSWLYFIWWVKHPEINNYWKYCKLQQLSTLPFKQIRISSVIYKSLQIQFWFAMWFSRYLKIRKVYEMFQFA